MPQMTPAQARVIDPVLTEVARGYRNQAMVGMGIFPEVPVGQRGGQIIEFDTTNWEQANTLRAPGTNTKRIDFGYSGKPFALEAHSLEGKVPIELSGDASAVPGLDLGRIAVSRVQDILSLRLEIQQAALATNANNYASTNKQTLSGTGQWSDPASDPIAAITTAAEAIRARIGMYPNTLTMGASVWAILARNLKVVEAVFWADAQAGIVTTDKFRSLFPWLETVNVGLAIYKDAAGNNTDVWGKFAHLCYSNRTALADMGSPSFAYTYRLRGHPFVEPAYYDRSPKSWIYPVTDEVAPVIVGADAGYLFSAAVA